MLTKLHDEIQFYERNEVELNLRITSIGNLACTGETDSAYLMDTSRTYYISLPLDLIVNSNISLEVG